MGAAGVGCWYLLINFRHELKMEQDTRTHEHDGKGIDLPLDRINPETLRKMLEEFVTREWSELADSEYTLDEKVDQVLQQLEDHRAKIVYDSTSETWNIIPCR